MSDSPTVFVLDDDQGVRESLKWLVESHDLAVETYSSAQDFFTACTPGRPGCLVLDIRMPDMGGLEVQKSLTDRGFTLPVIVLTGFGDVPTAVRAMKGGAVEFVEKPFNDQALIELIEQCIERDKRMRSELNQKLVIRERMELLTRREREVMELVSIGKSNKEIARELEISPKTVEVHRSRVMEKMQAGTLAELVQMKLTAT